MARNYANIWTAIWRNDDFRALSAAAQHTYLLLATQPDISAAGVLPLSVKRWSTRAKDTTTETVVAALQELQAHRFVYFDTETEELLVRSFVRWDGGSGNPKRRPVIQRAAAEVESPMLRRALFAEFARLGLPNDDLDDSDADSLSASLSRPDAADEAFSQANSLSDRQSPYDGVVVTKGPYVGPATHNPQPPAQAPAPRQARSDQGSRLPEDWEPDGKLLAWAKDNYPNVNLAEATLKFKNHWLSKSGKDATKRSWSRTYQNWVMEENRRLPKIPGHNGSGYNSPAAATNATPRIPKDERCTAHPNFPAKTCGPCRSEANARTRQSA